MSKQTIQRERDKKEAESAITRRAFIKNAGILTGIAGLLAISGYAVKKVYDSNHVPSYEEAFDKPEVRQKWLDSLQTRPYVTKKITSDTDLAELKRRFNYELPDGANAATIYNQDFPAGKGCTSTLYVHPITFGYEFKDLKKGYGRVMQNAIENHELIHADHYYQGIEGFPMKWFNVEENKLNVLLFLAVSELVSYNHEQKKLENKTGDKFIAGYKAGLVGLGKGYWNNIVALTRNKELIERARKECWWLN